MRSKHSKLTFSHPYIGWRRIPANGVAGVRGFEGVGGRKLGAEA